MARLRLDPQRCYGAFVLHLDVVKGVPHDPLALECGPTAEKSLTALDARTIDAYASDRTRLIGMGRSSKNPEELALIEEFFSREPHGFMLEGSDAAFRLSVNRTLPSMYRSGEAAPIYEKPFGSMSTAGPLVAAMNLMNGLPG